MSNINKQDLRLTAEKAKDNFMPNFMVPTRAVLALLDELEALKLANAAQDDHINQQQDRIDLLEKGNNEAARQINSWRRLAKQNIAEREKDVSELNIARKRIAELEAREVVLPSTQDVHPLGPQSAKIFCEFHRSIVNRCADEIRKVGVKVSIKGN
ncbi:ead/Ea22-like family protein [Enterobacter hormaechei]|uniref:ead/Ea22-like family protein n=1 Tax=Enterobacter cloacae complex TaxID=354276 RepID=UPI0034D25D05